MTDPKGADFESHFQEEANRFLRITCDAEFEETTPRLARYC